MVIAFGTREQKEVPRDFAQRITRVGGKSPFDQPMYRVVWGQSRKCWAAGKIELKYDDHNWHLEKWVPSSFYGDQRGWEAMSVQKTDKGSVDVLGPFPERGDYEEVTSFAPIELTQTYADYLVNVIETSRHFGSQERRDSMYRRQEKSDSDWDKWADDVIEDGFDAFHGVPHVVVPGNKGASIA